MPSFKQRLILISSINVEPPKEENEKYNPIRAVESTEKISESSGRNVVNDDGKVESGSEDS